MAETDLGQNDENSRQGQGQIEAYNDNHLYLQASDHPGLQLVNGKLNGSNFQRWTKSIRFALRTKAKLGFIDGSCEKPPIESHCYDQWIRCDSMVVNWLLNSMVSDLAEAFLYVNSAQQLWNELAERLVRAMGPCYTN